LITVAQVDTAPDWRLSDNLVRPTTIYEPDWLKRLILGVIEPIFTHIFAPSTALGSSVITESIAPPTPIRRPCGAVSC
jgi:hypothetical protein